MERELLESRATKASRKDIRSPSLPHAQDLQRPELAFDSHFDPLLGPSVFAGAANAQAQVVMLNRATATGPTRAAQSLLRLQRQYGNRHVQRVLALARQGEGEAELLPEVEGSIQRARGGGQGLDSSVRGQMESAFGTDFSGVRVHTDAEADALNQAVNAVAFTTGQDVFFRQGAYNPSHSSGRELLAHELTHVVQQGGGPVQGKLVLGEPGDAYEQEADQVAREVVGVLGRGGTAEGQSSSHVGSTPVQRQCACGMHSVSGGEKESLVALKLLDHSQGVLARQEDDEPPEEYPPDWQHGAPTKPVPPDPNVWDIPDPNKAPPDQGPPGYRTPSPRPQEQPESDPNQRIRELLPGWLIALLSAAAIALIVACFATGACEAAALIGAAGAATAAIVIGILRAAGVNVQGEEGA